MKVPEPRKLPSGSWFIQMRLGGVSVPVTASSRKECIRQAQLIKAEHRAGKREMRSSRANITIREGIDLYIDSKRNSLSPSTVRGYRTIQKSRFQKYMDTPMQSIKNWQAVYDSEINRLSAKTLQNSFALIKSVYLYHFGQKIPDVDMLQVAKKERPFFDADQISAFLVAVHGKPCELGALLALSSLRCSELLALTWENIDLVHDRIAVHGSVVLDENNHMVHKNTNKTNESWRYVPIFIQQLKDALCAVEDKDGYVVNYRTESGLIRAVNRVCASVGLPQVGLHGLRHSFASLCVHLQIPEETAMKIGGWSDFMTMRKIYTHISQRDLISHTAALQNFYSKE